MNKYLALLALYFFSLQQIEASEIEKAENKIDSLEQLIKGSVDNRDKGQWFMEVSEEQNYLKHYAEAILQIDNAIICAEKISNYNFMAQCLVRKAYIYIYSSQDVKLRAKKIAPVIKDIVAIMDSVDLPITRSRIYILQGIQVEIEHNYDDSDEMFNGLIAFQKKAIKELGLQPDTLEGADLILENDYKKLELASTLISRKRFSEALPYLDQVLTVKEYKSGARKIPLVKTLGYILLSEMYDEQKKTSLLKTTLDSSLFYCNKLDDMSAFKINSLVTIHQFLSNIGEYEKAYKVHLQYSELRELDFNETEILAQGKAEANLKMLTDSINQAHLLEGKNVKIEAKEQQNNWLISGVVSLLIILGIVFMLLKKIKTSKSVIEQKKHELTEALESKNLLLKEVHHRVKNNMQLVSSLLELQSEFAEDDFAKQVLNDGNDRIKALAFAHQKLYQNEDYENIELNDYFNQIIHHLLAKTNCKTDICVPDNFLIHIEKGQVLGFIINELIANSLKYAWKNTSEDKHISFSMTVDNNDIHFVYKDNGVGFPDSFSLDSSSSLGYTLIPSFVKRQLKGVMNCYNEGGAVIKITFPV